MEKMNKKPIVFGLKILSILVFSLIFVPIYKVSADSIFSAPTYVYGHDNGDGSYTFGGFVWNNSANGTDNPVPAVTSITPKSENLDTSVTTITVNGSGFVPTSVARINGSNRPVTFIDSSHLLVQINSNDINTYQANGGFYITVFNGAPGGGYSNAAFFAVNNNAGSTTNGTDSSNKSYGSLASNAIFGSNSFLPSGLVQWILFAIIILIIVIIIRKIFGGREHYDELPMKHA